MNSQRLHIIHMNDLHSRFSNMKKISSYINRMKEKITNMGEALVIVDIGDQMDRMQLETEGTNGRVNVEIMNQLGVSVATIGNNEGLTFTKETLKKAYKHKRFTLVACNLKDSTTNTLPEWLAEYFVQEVNGIKIGWIGATAPYETFYTLQGWNVGDPISNIKRVLNQIESEVDLVIILSHLGIKADEKLAKEIEGRAVAILGGHTHRLFHEGIVSEKSPVICQVGIFGEYVGHLTIDYDNINGLVLAVSEQAVPMVQENDNQNISEIIERYRYEAKEVLSELVVNLEFPMTITLEGESPLSNLLTDGVRKWVDAEIAFINNGQILDSLQKGTVTKERLHEICPSPINACRVVLTGEQIKTILEQSLLNEFVYAETKGFGFRGKQLGALSISGLSVEYSQEQAPYHKIKRIVVNDEVLISDKEYVVGTLDMFTFGGGYFLVREAKDIRYFLPEFLRDILAMQLIEPEAIQQSLINRWICR